MFAEDKTNLLHSLQNGSEPGSWARITADLSSTTHLHMASIYSSVSHLWNGYVCWGCCEIIYTKCFTSDFAYIECALINIRQQPCCLEKQKRNECPPFWGRRKIMIFVLHFMSSTPCAHHRGPARWVKRCYYFLPKPGVQQESEFLPLIL